MSYVHTDHELKKNKCKENIESIGPLTDYVNQGYGAHGVIEVYEINRMGNKQQYMSCTYTPLSIRNNICKENKQSSGPLTG